MQDHTSFDATQPDDAAQPELLRTLKMEVRGVQNLRIEGEVRGHTLHVDVPKEWGGEDTAPNPAETFAFALGACVVNTGRLIAGQEKLDLQNISAKVEGSIHMSKVLGMETTSRAGYLGFTIDVCLEGGLSEAEKTKLLNAIRERCPLCDTVANVTPFRLEWAK